MYIYIYINMYMYWYSLLVFPIGNSGSAQKPVGIPYWIILVFPIGIPYWKC